MLKFLFFRSLVSVSILLIINFNYGQEAPNIIKNYTEYIKIPREVSYLHLNKSTYIKGEQMGFMAYVLNKKDQTPSQLSSNLYIVVEDKNNNIINQQMLRLSDGKASNTIQIDSSFNSGYYTIKAFTNWMRNFREQDYFVESFRVIDPKIEKYIESVTIENEFDVQFFPESGHLLNNVENTVGVIVKDINGYGVPNVICKVYDDKRLPITNFKVNHMGIGRFKLIPELKKKYFVNISFNGTNIEYQIKNQIEPYGIILSTNENNNKLYVKIQTNEISLNSVGQNSYQLYLHNQQGITSFKIDFEDSNIIEKVFDLTQIPTGVSTLTLFDYNDKPILERLFLTTIIS